MSISYLEKHLLAAIPASLPRSQIEVALQDSLDYTQSILDTLRTPILILDSDLHIKTASRSFYQSFAISADTAEGEYLYDLEDGARNIPALLQKLNDVLALRNSFDDFEIEHSFPVLGKRSMLLNASKLWREENHATMILLVIEDITARKTIEGELLRSNEDLQSFAYVTAHDLRTPLNAALSLCQILSTKIREKLSETENRLLQSAITCMKEQNILIDDILSYSAAKSEFPKEQEVPLEEALQIALINLQAKITNASAVVKFLDIPDVLVNRTQLTLLFQNIIGNAVKYHKTDVPPVIQVSAKSAGGELKISISDNGLGFSAEDAASIFDPFTRLRDSEAGGNGIGLATCNRIVQRKKGRIWAESVKGEGSTFYITLPLEMGKET